MSITEYRRQAEAIVATAVQVIAAQNAADQARRDAAKAAGRFPWEGAA